jgi:bacillithiol synthase
LLKFDGKTFSAGAAQYSASDLEVILERDGSRITPAAGVRPVIADATFPVAVNVLGPGELAYHLELGGVYDMHCVAQPLMHPRMSVTIIEPPVERILKKYDLTAPEFVTRGRAALEERLLAGTTAAAAFRDALQQLKAGFSELHANLEPFEKGLGKALNRSESSVKFNLERLQRKLGASLLRAEDTATGQFTRLEAHLLPGGTPQERTVSFLEFQMKFGRVPLERFLKLHPTSTHWLEL